MNWDDCDNEGWTGETTKACARCTGIPAPEINTAGPYCDRIPPKYINEIIAGRGIGATSCSECALILFNNTSVTGTNNACANKNYTQIAVHEYGSAFAVTPGSTAGIACDCDETLHAKVDISDGGSPIYISFVTGICVTMNGSYVGDVTASCGTLTLARDCSEEFCWIKTSDNGDVIENNCGVESC